MASSSICKTTGPSTVVEMLDSAIHWITTHRISIRETYCFIYWTDFYPVDRFIHLSNNWAYEAEKDVKNYADQGGCYTPRLKAEVDNIL